MMLRVRTRARDIDGSIIRRVIVLHLRPKRGERFFLTYRSSIR